MKKPFDTSFKIFAFKGILVILLCFFIYMFHQISNYSSAKLIIMKKNCEDTKLPFKANFKSLASNGILIFSWCILNEKRLIYH
jgi:hypothetical protein